MYEQARRSQSTDQMVLVKARPSSMPRTIAFERLSTLTQNDDVFKPLMSPACFTLLLRTGCSQPVINLFSDV